MAETKDTTVLVAEAMGRGKKNLVVENYSEAAEEFSSVCEMLSELHGPSGDPLAEAYFLYGRALLGCAREEAKLLDITETAPNEDSENEVEAKNIEPSVSTNETEAKSSEERTSTQESLPELPEKEANEQSEDSNTNGVKDQLSEANVEENTGNAEDDDDDESEGDIGNLQLAWEVLEIASQILAKKDDQESKRLLAEVFSELGEVSLESSNFETALKDFVKSLELYEQLENPMSREIAEAHFKIGLSHALMNLFEEAVTDFTKAVEILETLIKDIPAEEKSLLDELNQTKAEILLKITDVKESKEQSMEAIREQLNKLWPKTSTLEGINSSSNSNGAGTSSSMNGVPSDILVSPSNKPAADISHLVKRKRKTDEQDEATCAKKPTP